jgi:hypothetical protein
VYLEATAAHHLWHCGSFNVVRLLHHSPLAIFTWMMDSLFDHGTRGYLWTSRGQWAFCQLVFRFMWFGKVGPLGTTLNWRFLRRLLHLLANLYSVDRISCLTKTLEFYTSLSFSLAIVAFEKLKYVSVITWFNITFCHRPTKKNFAYSRTDLRRSPLQTGGGEVR